MDLDKIIEGCKLNDRKCQEKLYKSFFPTMIVMCLRYVRDRNRAAEIVNDGFLKVFKHIDTFENKGSFEGWVRRIVFRSMSDSLRKEANYMKFMVFEDHDQKIKHQVLDKLYEEDILSLVEKIPTASADIFLLYAVHGYSHKEIAEAKSISVGTSKWHLSEARKRLKDLIFENYRGLNAG